MLEAPPVTVEEIVVTAARLPGREADLVFSTVEITPEDLGRSDRLDEVLTETPGVSLFRRTGSLAANPTTQGISLRAVAPSGAGRTLVLLDGVPLNDPFGGWVLWSQVAPETLGSAQIVRGAGAGPYGAGALTGVINLRERGPGSVLDLSGGDYGGGRLAGAGTTELGAVRLFAGGVWEVSDGYTPVRGLGRGAADTRLDLDARSAAVRIDAPLGAAGLDASVRLGAYEESRGAGLAGARAHAEGWSLSTALARQPRIGAGPGWRLQVWRRESDFANTSVSVAPGRTGTTPANDQHRTPATGWGANAALRGQGADWDWEAGLDARFNEGETNERFRYMGGGFTRDRRAGGRTSVAGLYAETSWTPGSWIIAGGLRADRWTSTDAIRVESDRDTGAITLDDRQPDAEGEVLSARFGVRRSFGEGLAWRAAAYSGFRPPTLNELHRPFRVGNDITEANAGLEPERLYGLEAGLEGEGSGFGWSVAAFVNRIDDPIANVTIAVGPGTFPRAGFVPAGGVLRERRNVGRIDAVGLEADAWARLGERLTLRLAAGLTEAEVRGGAQAPQLTGLRPAQAPRWSVSAGLDWRAADRLSLSGALRWEGDRHEDDLNSRVLDAAATLDLRAEWRAREDAVVYLALDNVFDARAAVSETADGVEGYGPPRMWRVGVRLTR